MAGLPALLGWGIYQPYGWFTLFVSGAVYASALAGCVLLIQRAATRIGSPQAGLVVGLLALSPMVAWCGESIAMQFTSAHYTPAHLKAVVMSAGTVLAVGVVAGWVELYTRRRGRQPGQRQGPRQTDAPRASGH